MKTYLKFGALVTVILGALVWNAVGSVKDTSSYYKTIAEMNAMGPAALEKRIRVTGNVEKGSIARNGAEVRFTLIEENRKLNVVYTSSEPLPDTLRDNAQALADGKLAADGSFHATKVAAKCASKYEAKPGDKYKGIAPVNGPAKTNS